MTHAFIWLVDAAWIGLVVHLTVSAIGVKRDTKPHLAQSFGLLVAMIVALLLPRLPIFKFVNFASGRSHLEQRRPRCHGSRE